MLFLKLIIRSLFRHKKRGKKLIVFISACVMAIFLSITFSSSFHKRYLEQLMDTSIGHLRIISKTNPKVNHNGAGDFAMQVDEIHVMNIDNELDSFIKSLNEVSFSTKTVETNGSFFTIDGEEQDNSVICGINPDEINKVFPAFFVEGGSNFKWNRNQKDIPVLRRDLAPWDNLIKEGSNTNYYLKSADLRCTEGYIEEFKLQVKNDFKNIFSQNIKGNIGTEYFIKDLNNGLKRKDFYTYINQDLLLTGNYKIDDAISDIKKLAKDNENEIVKYNRKLLNSIYSNKIAYIEKVITLNTPLTLVATTQRNGGKDTMPKVIPIKFVGYAKNMPLLSETSYIDIKALKKYLGLNETEFTDYIIRLKDINSLYSTKEKIQNYLDKNNLPYFVGDYLMLGAEAIPTIVAFDFIFGIVCVLFLVTVIFFTVNLVLLTIIKRRKEIGMSIAIGMNKKENILILLGEVFVIITFSWIIGSVIGTIIVGILINFGIPGMIFFNTGKLYFIFEIKNLFFVYLFVIPAALLAALFPCLSILKFKPVEILRETN